MTGSGGYGEIVRSRIRGAQNVAGRPLSIRELSQFLGKSYEHCRKIALGEAVISERLNAELCRILKLDPQTMWRLAGREKAAKRFGWDIYSGPDMPLEDRLGEIWHKLDGADRTRVLRFAEALLVSGTAEPNLPFEEAGSVNSIPESA